MNKNNLLDLDKLVGSFNAFDTVSYCIGKTYKITDFNGERYICIDETMSIAYDYAIIDSDGERHVSPERNADDFNFFKNKTLKKLYKTTTIIEFISKMVILTDTINWFNLDTVISEKKLLKWCSDYTLPISSKNPFEPINTTGNTPSTSGISLRRLQEEVFCLYIVFQLWQLIKGVDSRIRNVVIESFPEPPEEVEAVFWHAKNSLSNPSVCLGAIADVYNFILKPSSTYNFVVTDREIKIENEANGIIDLFALNLAILMKSDSKIAENSSKMKKCAVCDQAFWPTHGQQKYCPLHNRKSACSRKHPEYVKNAALSKKIKLLLEQGKSLNEISETIGEDIEILTKLINRWKKS